MGKGIIWKTSFIKALSLLYKYIIRIRKKRFQAVGFSDVIELS